MRVETESAHDADNPRPKCYLTSDEFDLLKRVAPTTKHNLVVRVMGRCGLRSFEVPQIKPRHARRDASGDHYFLRVPRGKDTQTGSGKARDTFLNTDLEADLYRYANEQDIPDHEPFFDYSPRWIQQLVRDAADAAQEETGDPDWEKFSSHDLRVYFGHTLLVEERMNPEVVMDVGGWNDYQSIKPYLGKPSEENIISEFERVGWS